MMKPTLILRIIFFFYVHASHVHPNPNATPTATVTQACSIAFVHLGSDLPKYIADAIYQARLFNPANPIYLLAQQAALHKKNVYEILQMLHNTLQVTIVPIETLPPSQEHIFFEKTSRHDTTYRKGFWNFTVQRFFVLDDFMSHNNITNLIHLESDTLLYRTVDELLPTLRTHYHGIATVFISDTHCIPCFVYLRDKTAIKQLTTYLAQQAHTGKNDMLLLSEFKTKMSTHLIASLPIIPRTYILCHGLKNLRNEPAHNPEDYCNHIAAFNSVFDGNAIGQYLGGIDPRLGKSKPFSFINPDCFFNPALLTFEWKKDALGRTIPFMTFNDEAYQINNLHISSKNLKAFLSVEH